MMNVTDVCLYLSYFLPGPADERAPAGDLSAGGRNISRSFYSGNSTANPLLETIKYLLAGVINPALCVFGIVGNAISVLVLSRRRMQVAVILSLMMQVAVILSLMVIRVRIRITEFTLMTIGLGNQKIIKE